MNPNLVYLLLFIFLFSLLVNFISKMRFSGKLFVIKITHSKAIIIKGSPPVQFLKDSNIIAKKYRDIGYIYGVKNSHGIALEFSKGITESSSQRLRNVFPFESYKFINK